jgi:hypothetical protein
VQLASFVVGPPPFVYSDSTVVFWCARILKTTYFGFSSRISQRNLRAFHLVRT